MTAAERKPFQIRYSRRDGRILNDPGRECEAVEGILDEAEHIVLTKVTNAEGQTFYRTQAILSFQSGQTIGSFIEFNNNWVDATPQTGSARKWEKISLDTPLAEVFAAIIEANADEFGNDRSLLRALRWLAGAHYGGAEPENTAFLTGRSFTQPHDVDTSPLMWESAETDEPLDQNASAWRMPHAWYSIGPDHPEGWSVILVVVNGDDGTVVEEREIARNVPDEQAAKAAAQAFDSEQE